MGVTGNDAGWLRPVVGVGAVIWRGPDVVLVRRGKPPRAGQWSLPGGKQEPGETVEAAVRREVHEETGLALGPLTLVDVIDLIERDPAGLVTVHFTLIDYTGEALDGPAVAGSDATEVGWFSPVALADLGLWPKTVDVIEGAHQLRTKSA